MGRGCGNDTTFRSAGLTGIIPRLSVMSLVMERALLPTRQFLLGRRRCILPSWRKSIGGKHQGLLKHIISISCLERLKKWQSHCTHKRWMHDKLPGTQERFSKYGWPFYCKCIWFVSTHKTIVRLLCSCSCVFLSKLSSTSTEPVIKQQSFISRICFSVKGRPFLKLKLS